MLVLGTEADLRARITAAPDDKVAEAASTWLEEGRAVLLLPIHHKKRMPMLHDPKFHASPVIQARTFTLFVSDFCVIRYSLGLQSIQTVLVIAICHMYNTIV